MKKLIHSISLTFMLAFLILDIYSLKTFEDTYIISALWFISFIFFIFTKSKTK